MLSNTKTFIKNNRGFLFFAILLSFFSSYGQSFFFGLYNNSIREKFVLTSAEFGSIYGIITLVSAIILSFAGKLIDKLSLQTYITALLILLSTACLLMGVAESFPFFLLALFLTRFSGQGLMSHAASTTMTKYFKETRGRAIAIGRLGHHLGEILLPPLAVFLLARFFWQTNWLFYSAFTLFCLLPLCLFLLRNHNKRHEDWENMMLKEEQESASNLSQWTQKKVLCDPRFYLIVPALVAEPMINTGVFFHSGAVANAKSWELSLVAGSFSLHALTTVFCSLFFGNLIDKKDAKSFLFVLPLPLAAGMFLMSQFSANIIFPIYMCCSGITKGMLSVVGSSLWAELYGVKNLGAIKALFTTVVVLSTAVMPPLLGYLLDSSISMETIASGLLVYLIASAFLTKLVDYCR